MVTADIDRKIAGPADAEAIPGVDPLADENLLRQSLGA
jgi:hypothetical protein